MQTINPAKTQIFAKPTEKQNTTKAGIFLTDSAVEQPKFAEIINVGKDVKDYKAKDVIVYKEYTTTDIKLNGEDFILIDAQDVLGEVVEVK